MTGEDNDKNNEGDICEQRHDCHNAATKPPRSRVIFHLRVIQHNTFLCICASNSPCPRDAEKRTNQPQGEDNKSDKEKPRVPRTATSRHPILQSPPRFARLPLCRKTQAPRRTVDWRRLPRISHMKISTMRNRWGVRGHQGRDRYRNLRKTSP
jgi:hypothetical protein